MAKKGGAGREREAAGVVPFRGREGNAEPAMPAVEDTPAAKPGRRARVVPIGRARARPKAPFPEQQQAPPGIEAKMEPRPLYRVPEYRPAAKLAGKVALITGGDSGIGRAVALLFAREGADCALVYLPSERRDAEQTRSDIEAMGQHALLVPGDVRDPAFCKLAVERAVAEYGQLDVLVNNAAYEQHHERIEEIRYEDWDRTFKTNIYGYFLMAQAAVPHFGTGGVIINTGSITGLEGSPHPLDYAATKGAIHAFTKSLAQNLVKRGIRVNCVAPGPSLNAGAQPGFARRPATGRGRDSAGAPSPAPFAPSWEHGNDVPMGRPAQPEEIAPAYVFFASETDSGTITGEVLTLLGAETTAG